MACTVLPQVNFSEDCAGEIYSSEIEEVYVGKSDTAAFTDWTDPAEWATRLSQTASVTGNELRKLIVIGDKPAAQPVVVTVSKKRKAKIDATHQLNAEIDDVTQENYDAALTYQAGGYQRIWWKNRGGNMFGGNAGVLVFFDVNPQGGRGEEFEKLIVSAAWNSKTDPERIVSPI